MVLQINEIATATDATRLKLLREVAGTGIYDVRRKDCLKLLQDIDALFKKAKTCMQELNEKLHSLEEEKRELAEYQHKDNIRQTLEIIIYENELKDVKSKLDTVSI